MKKIISACALIFSVICIAVFRAEYMAYAFSVDVKGQQAALVSTGALPSLSLSRYGRLAYLDPCLSQDSDLVYRLSPDADRRALAEGCLALTDRMEGASGALSEAALAGAISRDILGEQAKAEENLVRSQALAPRVAWIAQKRADVVGGWELQPQSAAARLLAADLEVLASDAQNVPVLVSRYQTWDGAAREAVQAALESAPGDVQQNFLNLLRQ